MTFRTYMRSVAGRNFAILATTNLNSFRNDLENMSVSAQKPVVEVMEGGVYLRTAVVTCEDNDIVSGHF